MQWPLAIVELQCYAATTHFYTRGRLQPPLSHVIVTSCVVLCVIQRVWCWQWRWQFWWWRWWGTTETETTQIYNRWTQETQSRWYFCFLLPKPEYLFTAITLAWCFFFLSNAVQQELDKCVEVKSITKSTHSVAQCLELWTCIAGSIPATALSSVTLSINQVVHTRLLCRQTV